MLSFIASIVKTEFLRLNNLMGWSLTTAVVTGAVDQLLKFNEILNALTTVIVSLATIVFVVVRAYYSIKNKGK